MGHPMNRTADELINAMAFCLLDGKASGFLIGDNEMARLVVEWRRMREALLPLGPDEHYSDCATNNGPALDPGPCNCK